MRILGVVGLSFILFSYACWALDPQSSQKSRDKAEHIQGLQAELDSYQLNHSRPSGTLFLSRSNPGEHLEYIESCLSRFFDTFNNTNHIVDVPNGQVVMATEITHDGRVESVRVLERPQERGELVKAAILKSSPLPLLPESVSSKYATLTLISAIKLENNKE